LIYNLDFLEIKSIIVRLKKKSPSEMPGLERWKRSVDV